MDTDMVRHPQPMPDVEATGLGQHHLGRQVRESRPHRALGGGKEVKEMRRMQEEREETVDNPGPESMKRDADKRREPGEARRGESRISISQHAVVPPRATCELRSRRRTIAPPPPPLPAT